jgi:hypothetical protein
MSKVINSNIEKHIGREFNWTGKGCKIGLGFWGNEWAKPVKYSDNEITNSQVIDASYEAEQSVHTGRVLGAGAGALAFGPLGAVVGALVIGKKNKTVHLKHVAIEFNNKDWIVVEYNTNTGSGEIGYKTALEVLGIEVNNPTPFGK